MVKHLIEKAICEASGDIRSPCVAEYLDCQYTTDSWKCLREQFFIPKFCHFTNLACFEDRQNEECIYLCGHSLGLQPRCSIQLCNDILTRWGTMGVLSHCMSDEPFNACDLNADALMAKLTGANEDEIVIMNSLTINLHLMLACFYRPDRCRFKIIHEDNIFSSDKYALESVVRRFGLDPAITCISGGNCQESIIHSIEEHSSSVALVFIGSVQYFTGYRFDLKQIVDAGHDQGAIVGFDLAHSVGVIPLNLHEDNVDFAVWCTYKYLCGGPSSVGAAFIHQNHHKTEFNGRMDGWWGCTPESRFTANTEMIREEGAKGFRVSHPNPFQCNLLKPSLEMLTNEMSICEINNRGSLLTEYLLQLIDAQFPCIEILTPRESDKRGFQLTIQSPGERDCCVIQNKLENVGIIVDTRLNYLRISVHPLYTTFTELYKFVLCLATIVCEIQ